MAPQNTQDSPFAANLQLPLGPAARPTGTVGATGPLMSRSRQPESFGPSLTYNQPTQIGNRDPGPDVTSPTGPLGAAAARQGGSPYSAGSQTNLRQQGLQQERNRFGTVKYRPDGSINQLWEQQNRG